MPRSLAIALSVLTRLPVSPPGLRVEELRDGVRLFPVVGLVLGLALAAIGGALDGALSHGGLAVLSMALLAGITGALHLDGVADVADALGGGRGERARMLEIMKDPRIGAHGAVALVLVLLAKVIFLADALSGDAGLVALLLFPAVGRAVCALAVVGFPYARAEGGTGGPFAGADPTQVRLWSALVGLGACGIVGTGPALVAALVAGVVGLAFATWLARRLGGLTGDGYGATLELAELAFLAAL